MIYFKGERRRGNKTIRNNDVAAYLNYGRPNTPNNPMEATRFIDKAVKKTKKQIENEMQRVFDEETGRA